MAVQYRPDEHRITISGVIGVEEAEELCQLLAENPGAPLNLAECQHLHTAVLQVLMAARCTVAAPPQDPLLRGLIMPALSR